MKISVRSRLKITNKRKRRQKYYTSFTKTSSFKHIKCQCCPHIETSQLICCANQLTGFYMRATLALNGLNTIIATILNKKII